MDKTRPTNREKDVSRPLFLLYTLVLSSLCFLCFLSVYFLLLVNFPSIFRFFLLRLLFVWSIARKDIKAIN